MSCEPAVHLAWLAPSPAALAALARPGDLSPLLADPAALILVYRFPDDSQAPIRFALDALRREPTGVVPADAIHLIDYCRRLGDEAERIALATGNVDATTARIAASVAPLGRLAIAATGVAGDPAKIGRRLARRWNLPAWLANVIGNIDLAPEIAANFGADASLLFIVRAALDAVSEGKPHESVKVADPYREPLLIPLLELALDRTAEGALEAENEALRRAIIERQSSEDERLSSRKLDALAEFAAGAGHEINNPLAVMSGQAQYLLVRETEPERQKALQTVVAQAQRIHAILTDVMQFARPAKPRFAATDVAELAREVASSLADYAAAKSVRVDVNAGEGCVGDIDAKQTRTALAALLRNAIEAAIAAVRLVVESSDDTVTIAVEDDGPGPNAEQAGHMFDPFYSGRAAGRGRGLGLPTAWRLAREQGGDVRFAGNNPTRFVLSLPRVASLRLTA